MSLTLNDIDLEASENHELRLPILLRTLSVYRCDSWPLSDIVNRNQLDNLSSVKIRLSGVYSKEVYINPKRNKRRCFQLGKFLCELPALKYFELGIYFEAEGNRAIKQIVQHMCLDTFDSLTGFSFWTVRSIGFPISYLPPKCFTLQLDAFTTLSRQFPETLHTLDITLASPIY
ncbi:unnamed protein product [Ambrosiozyma monospora]|uniref:Unnamed protein product n=1 Tax=Ambrosiozyma monospora TaxID=43982 RepID=A0ACB5U823_AMBMO|nr:unnamed protein product [Ambrosiozyma monospora]